MPASHDTADASAWTALWSHTRQGAVDFSANNPISQALRTHWKAQVPWLSHCHEAVDVGSGPAVLPLWLRETAPAQLDALRWQCLDLALIPPMSLPDRINLRPGFDFGTNPLPCRPVHALVSNFGLEYVARHLCPAACARWLTTGGTLCAVIHARHSVIDETSSQSLDDLNVVLQRWQIFDRAQNLFQAIAHLPSDPKQRPRYALTVRSEYNHAVDDLKQRMVARGERSQVWIDILTGLTELSRWATAGRVSQATRQCTEMASAYAAELQRLDAMRAVAMSDNDLVEFSNGLKRAGLTEVVWQALRCPLGTVGWALTARRGSHPRPEQ